jgi:hypothetical protein
VGEVNIWTPERRICVDPQPVTTFSGLIENESAIALWRSSICPKT